MKMSPDQRLVGQIKPGRSHAAGDHFLSTLKKVLVVAVDRPAIGEDQAGLSLSAGPTAPLYVIRRRRGDVAEMDEVEISNINAEFHRRRANQVGEPTPEFSLLALVVVLPPETALASFALAQGHDLGCVLAPLQRRKRR